MIPNGTPTPLPNVHKRLVDTPAASASWDLLRRALQQVDGKCAGCYVFPYRDYAHPTAECLKGTIVEKWIPALRRRLHFLKDSCCFRCVLPKRVCNARYNGTPCQQPPKGILSIALAMHLYQECTRGFFAAEGYPVCLRNDIGEHDIGVFTFKKQFKAVEQVSRW